MSIQNPEINSRINSIDEVISNLKKNKPRIRSKNKKIAMKDLLRARYEEIRELMEFGYKQKDIAKKLTDSGLNIKDGTLRVYLSILKAEIKNEQKNPDTRKKQSIRGVSDNEKE